MECILSKYSQISNLEDISTPNNSGSCSDDFFVDELLNLNHDEEQLLQQQEDCNVCGENDYKFEFAAVKQQQFQLLHFNDTNYSFVSPPLDSVLSVPEAEEADLEWLSHFVEDSFSQFSTPYPLGFAKPKPDKDVTTSFTPPKARRSKRARTGGRVWSAGLSHPSSITTQLSPEPNKQKKRENGPFVFVGGCGPTPSTTRRCSHCGVQKTPQWRAGPMGAKTLCNACGVRYKSGRLLPEYRPACSPTFSSKLHSNSHRKVLEMRKKKEVVVTGQSEPGTMSHPLSSFG